MKKNLDIIYNMEYLVVVPSSTSEFYDDIKFTFKNVIFIDNSINGLNKTIDYIYQNNFNQIILVNYISEYEDIINKLSNKCIFKFMCTFSLASLSDPYNLYSIETIYNLYKNKKIAAIGFLDMAFYDTLKEKNNDIFKIDLDSDVIKTSIQHDNQVGLLNNFWNGNHSFYNELSAIGLSRNYVANLYKPHRITKNFIKLFGLKYVISKSMDELISSNQVNLYVNFTSNDVGLFLKSMDSGVPCIVGNNYFLKDYKALRDYLMVKSDDNIDEIKSKIDSVIENKEDIFKEYKKFRDDYRKNVLKNLNLFIGKKCLSGEEDAFEKLVTVVVPVYNVQKYIKNTLDSIITAISDDCEILVINDGSTDDSEKIIKEYVLKYPELIRYIYQENRGLGNVRNVALKEAKGKYIASIDSDDTINSNFFIEALPYLKSDIDMVIYDFSSITDTGRFKTPALDPVFKNESIFDGLLYTTIMPSTCNKIIKKSLFKQLDINYIEDKYEDLSTNPFILLCAKTIKYIPKDYYEYYIRENSIMRSNAGYSMIDVLKLFNTRLNLYKDNFSVSIERFKYYTYSWRIEEFIMNQLYCIEGENLKKFIDYIYSNVYDIVIDIFSSEQYQNLIESLNSDFNKYIVDRNSAFKNKNLYKFISEAKKKNEIYKLTASIIYYGE